MRYYLDTEFAESPGFMELISIGIVSENGREYYAISSEYHEDRCNSWVMKNVLPKLKGERKKRDQIRDEVYWFIGRDRPEFWGYFSDYDWVNFCWLFGSMADFPREWPMLCLDIKQIMLANHISRDDLEVYNKNVHNALDDARWTKLAHDKIRGMI